VRATASFPSPVCRPARSHTSVSYDTLGDVQSYAFPMGDIPFQAPSYDPSGDLTQYTDGDARVKTLTLAPDDARVTAVSGTTPTGATDPTQAASIVYDSYDRVTSMTDSQGTYAYTYDPLGNVLTATTTYTGKSALTITYTYNTNGTRASMTTPVGTYNYSYDYDGRLYTMSTPQGTVNYVYDADSRVKSQTLQNSLTTTYTYDALGHLTDLKNTGLNSGAAATFSEFSASAPGSYDGLGNRLGFTANVYSLSSNSLITYSPSQYIYDSLNRLTYEVNPWFLSTSNSYSYDNSNNLITSAATASGMTFNGDNQIVESSNTSAYVYDGEGNPTTYGGGRTLTYDANDNLTGVNISGTTTFTAGYRADGLRAFKGTTYYLYDGDQIVAELPSGSTTGAIPWTWGPTGLIGRGGVGSPGGRGGPASPPGENYLYDLQGNAIQTVNASTGALTANRTYTVFGQPQQPVADPVGFGGQVGYYTDAETGFVLCTARYYDPTLGRWLTRDPIGYDGGIDVYAYCDNNPEMSVDPDGLDLIDTLLAPFHAWKDRQLAAVSNLSDRFNAWLCPGNRSVELAMASASAFDVAPTGAPHLLGLDNPLAEEVEGGSAGMAADPAWFLANGAMTVVDAPEEAAAGTADVLAAVDTADPVAAYEVGEYDALRARYAADGGENGAVLEMHHMSQAHPAQQVVQGYVKEKGPAIALPVAEHRRLAGRNIRGIYSGTPQQLIAKGMRDLAERTNAPRAARIELYNLNRSKFPGQIR
jgi:RHS repeat-associated protein